MYSIFPFFLEKDHAGNMFLIAPLSIEESPHAGYLTGYACGSSFGQFSRFV